MWPTTFAIDPRTLQRWIAHERATGSFAPKPKAGGWRCPIALPLLHGVIADAPDGTMAELCRAVQPARARDGPHYGQQLRARDAARGIRVQKKRPRPSEIDCPDVQAKRAAFVRWMRRIDPDRLVFLDEAGANLAMGRSHAWVLRGREFVEARPMNWGDNLTLVGAIRRGGWVTLGHRVARHDRDTVSGLGEARAGAAAVAGRDCGARIISGRRQSMFLRLRQLVARLVGRRPPSSGPTHDPYAGVREPRRRPPGGRNSAVAVMEPEPDQRVSALGQFWRRRRR